MLIYLQLIEEPKNRDKFSRIYQTYRQRMYYAAHAILKNEMDAENIVHDTFLILIDHLDNILEEDCHRTWNYIVTIVKHLSFNHLKKEKRYTKVPFEDYMEEMFEFVSIDDAIHQKNREDALVKAIKSLPYPYKEVLYLQYYNELNSMEIAFLMDKTPENIRKISQRAKEKLNKILMEGRILDE